MKLGIIIPLKSRQVASHWLTVCNSLKKTLNSIINQTNNNYKVQIVGHEKPDFLNDSNYSCFDFHSITEISPPTKKEGITEITQEQYTLDKNMKIAKGMQLLYSSTKDITHWFVLDADDLLNKYFMAICDKTDSSSGAIINKGYIYYANAERVIKCNELSLYCGSTGIIPIKNCTPPSQINENTIQKIPFCRYSHMNLGDFFTKELQTSYQKFSENLVIYVLENGENISDGYRNKWLVALKQKLKPYIKGKKVTEEIKSLFSIK
jgi:hypothetical protein